MALSIKSEEADQLARLTGQSMTHAIARAMRERLERVRAERDAQKDDVVPLLFVGEDFVLTDV